MMKIEEILKKYHFHDSHIFSIKTSWDGKVALEVDLDDVWNTKTIKELIFLSTYEISKYKIDRMNVVVDVEVNYLDDYEKDFVTTDTSRERETVEVKFLFAAGGLLSLIAENNFEIKA